MFPTMFPDFSDIKNFDFDELRELLPHLTGRQQQILHDECIHRIQFILNQVNIATRENKIEDVTTYNYYGSIPFYLDKEDKKFFLATIISYFMFKDFHVEYKFFENHFSLGISW